MIARKIVAYYRVSTHKQGADGLGMDAQKADLARYVAGNGCDLIAEYVEVESARSDSLKNRPQLQNAIAHAKRSGAVLVIAKLDRLSRSVSVTAQIMVSGVEFIACDNPHANRMTIQMMAVMAEQESRAISERTKAAMQAAKARGRTFGTPSNLTSAARLKGAQRAAMARTAKALDAYRDLCPMINALRADGMSFSAISAHLNALGHTTRRQCPWTKMQVARILSRTEMVAA